MAFFRVSDSLSDFLSGLALAGGGPGLVRGDADGGDGSTIHTGKTNEVAVGVGDGDGSGFFHFGCFFDDHVEGAFGFGVIEGVEGSHTERI